MRQVIIVSLDKVAYNIEDEGYATLRQYLDDAKASLQDDPDAAEILNDVERSIGTKCAATLRRGKTVVSAEEMKAILEEIGPVVGESSSEARQSRTSEAAGPKRLYRQPNGAVVEGVCMGLSEYFNIDVVVFRIIFVALAVGAGIGVPLYFIMMVAVPSHEPQKPKVPLRDRLPRIHPAILLSAALLLLILSLVLLPWVNREMAFEMGGVGLQTSGLTGLLALLLFVGAIVLSWWGFVSNRARRARE
jgi:phage shock protein PspC (stress-responsive transcriptional regulator)